MIHLQKSHIADFKIVNTLCSTETENCKNMIKTKNAKQFGKLHENKHLCMFNTFKS